MTLDTAGVEAAAWKIIVTREAMRPTRSGISLVGSPVNVSPGAYVAAEPRPEVDEVLIRMMHPGLGWIGVQLDRSRAERFIEQIRAALDVSSSGGMDK